MEADAMDKKTVNTNRISSLVIAIIMLVLFSSCSENRETESTEATVKKETVAEVKGVSQKKLVYIVSDIGIPFWEIMGRGVRNASEKSGYELEILSAGNDSKTELESHLNKVKSTYNNETLDYTDGIKVTFKDSWLHVRASNTEPIIRYFAEAKTKEEAQKLIDSVF